MEYQRAVDTYVRVLVDIATVLDSYREARAEFDTDFLLRIMHDGFLQPVTENDRNRLLQSQERGDLFAMARNYGTKENELELLWFDFPLCYTGRNGTIV